MTQEHETVKARGDTAAIGKLSEIRSLSRFFPNACGLKIHEIVADALDIRTPSRGFAGDLSADKK